MTGAPDLHVVIGAGGATGRLVTRELHERGLRVRAVTRDGRDVGTAGVERHAADALDTTSMVRACGGARSVYFCAMPVFARWQADFPVMTDALLRAAAAAGARLVYADNTWMYGRVAGPMTEDTPYRPISSRGTLRAWLAERMLAAGLAGRLPVSVVRAGELYGPGVSSLIADSVFRAAARGRRVHWFGNPDLPLTPTFVGDFARTLVAVGCYDSGWATTWLVPHPDATTGRELAATACRLAGTQLRLSAHGTRQVQLLGTILPLARAGAEVIYQLEQPFVLDGSRAASAFNLRPTAYDAGVVATLSEHSLVGQRQRELASR